MTEPAPTSGPGTTPVPGTGLDVDLVVGVIAEVGRRLRDESPEGLGHPVAVDAKLARHLARAQAGAALPVSGRVLGRLAPALDPVLDVQRDVNAALVEVLHMLDHRTRDQAEQLHRLRADLEALRTRVTGDPGT